MNCAPASGPMPPSTPSARPGIVVSTIASVPLLLPRRGCRMARATGNRAAGGGRWPSAACRRHDARRSSADTTRTTPMNLARFPRIRLGHGPTPLEPMENLIAPPRRAAALDQARRLHGPVHRRQQDAQAGVPDGRRPRAGGGHRHHPGRDAVQPRAPDGGGLRQARRRVPHPAGGPHRLHGRRLPHVRQRALGQAARRERGAAAGRRRHAGGDGGGGGAAARRGPAPLRHPGRRIESGGRAGLCDGGAGTGGAGGGDGTAGSTTWSTRPAARAPRRGW